MGERDLGVKTSTMQEREPKRRRARPLGEATDREGTEADVLPEEQIEELEDEDLAEARAIDADDVPEDDYYPGEAEEIFPPRPDAQRGTRGPRSG